MGGKMEGILFQSPFILGGFILAIVLLVFELRTKSTGYILPVISVALTVADVVYGILRGVTLQEIAIIFMVFIIINIVAFKSDGEQL